jgi:hypothetical protein
VNESAVWSARTEEIHNGRRVQICRQDECISFHSYLKLLETDQEFRSWYTDLLSEAGYEAFFWEHPPLCHANIDLEAEFVLLNSPALAGLRPDPGPFSSYFTNDDKIVSFRSLGGDAQLIAPSPFEPLAACAHLAVFVREAPRAQVGELWCEAGKAMRASLGDRKIWLSTSGLGVSWLHIRLDTYPKYYQHRPYAETNGPFGLR